jgi:hypothetical protein
MNFIQMQDRIANTLGMQETVSVDERDIIKKYLNEGLIDILVRTRPYARVISLNLSADTPVHDMANSILSLLDIEYGSYGFLPRMTREDAVSAQSQLIPGFAYEEPLLWISPVPSTAISITAYGIFRPDPLVGDTDDPQVERYGGLAPEFHPAIINYALWKSGEYTHHEMSQFGERWRQVYEGKDGTEGDIARIKRILAKRVTPQAARKRDLSHNIGSVSPSGTYIGAG